MLDDIVVNKIIQDEGFEPYSEVYPSMVLKEAIALNKGKNFYKMFNSDPIFKNRFITFRYVLAWGFNEYYTINNNLRVDIKKYIKAVKKQYKELAVSCTRITDSIKTNNIFKPEGHKKICEDVLGMWELKELIELESFDL